MNYEKTKELAKSGHQLVVLLGTQNGMHEAASLVQRMAGQLEVLAAVLREKTKRSDALVAENTFLINMAARELTTSWMFHKTMLGAQAALVCVAQGDIKSARNWLEGTTDEAGAELPDDITVAGLDGWFNAQMVSNDGKTGFLTRDEAEKAIRAETPATDAFLRELKAQGVGELAQFAGEEYQRHKAVGDRTGQRKWKGFVLLCADFANQIRKGGAA
ncbi:hypothetical protein [Cronobacter sakazakii]|uniref:hypothetical protein n=1 Tax=Cronobacter sakazakii TaxID=28141 RepID=UPI001F35AAAF|nr:hypothetical protein [Cronobacter sakazakii]